MTLDNLTSLIDGQLLNDVSISSFNAITDKASRIQRGDLYVCIDQGLESIKEALDNGAYGIIFDKITPTIDQETAWIRVEDAFEAHLKLLRFHLMPKNIDVFYADSYTIEYISMLQCDQECKIIDNDISDITNKLWHLNESQKLILKKQADIITLFPMAKELTQKANYLSFTAISAYESDLNIQDKIYKRLKVPVVLYHAFSVAICFLQDQNISFSLDNITLPKSFCLLTTDKNLSVKEFGRGSRNVLFTDDDKMAHDFLETLLSLSPWIQSKVFLNKNLNKLSYNQTIIFSDKEELLSLLKSENFDMAIVLGQGPDILESISKPQQPNLFQLEF